jgi:hypothetical protein
VIRDRPRDSPPQFHEKTRAAWHYSQGIRRTQATNRKKGRKHAEFLRWRAKTLIPRGFSTAHGAARAMRSFRRAMRERLPANESTRLSERRRSADRVSRLGQFSRTVGNKRKAGMSGVTNWSSLEQPFATAVKLARRPVAVAFLDPAPANIERFTGTAPWGCSFGEWRPLARFFYAVPENHFNGAVGLTLTCVCSGAVIAARYDLAGAFVGDLRSQLTPGSKPLPYKGERVATRATE